jgi:hypothetical protein
VGTKLNWSAPTDWQTVCARAAARRKYNSLRRLRAEERRRQVLELALQLGGLGRGVQTTIAAVLGVHRSTVSKDLKRIMPLARPCPSCGLLQPRLWLDDA